MHRCRECDLLLLRTRPACPQCRALRPEAQLVVLGPRRDRVAALPWAAAGAAAVPLLLAVDQAARWLLGGGA